jgi:hypothetical protein
MYNEFPLILFSKRLQNGSSGVILWQKEFQSEIRARNRKLSCKFIVRGLAWFSSDYEGIHFVDFITLFPVHHFQYIREEHIQNI